MRQKKSRDQRAREIDARWNIPRLAEAQYASSYRALIDFMQAVASSGLLLLFALFSALCLAFTIYFVLDIGAPVGYTGVGAAFVVLLVITLLGVDLIAVWMPFSRLRQRESHGNARRATLNDLVGHGLAILRGSVPEVDVIIIGLFGAFHYLVNTIEQFSGHSIYVGPPRSGKSASFFIPQIRQFARFGSTLALAIKGEIYKYTALYYRQTYRIDLNSPEKSDRLPLLAACRNNAVLAGELCALFVSLEPPSRSSGSVNDKFFAPAAVSLGKSLILHLANTIKNPTPAHIVQFIGKHPRDVEVEGPNGKPQKIDLLDVVLSRSPSEEVRSNWAIFKRYDPKLQGGIIATLVTALDQFTLPNVQVVFSAPTELDRQRGVKVVDFRKLREKGTAIYICIDEGKDKELANVIAAIFGFAYNVLKRTSDSALECPCYMSLDEASNIYLNFVRGGVGVGRGLGIFFGLGVQGYEFLEDLYGQSQAASIWAATGNKYILPGTVGKAAKLASDHAGTTTGLSRTSVDANSDANDSERASEHGRPLVDQQSIREMLMHTQALAIIGDCPAIHFAFPPNAKDTDPRQAPEPHYNFELPPPLEESTPAPPDIDEILLQAVQDQPAREEEEEQAHERMLDRMAEELAPGQPEAQPGGERDVLAEEEAPLQVGEENAPPNAEFETDGVALSHNY